MNIGINIHQRKGIEGFIADIKRDIKYRTFWKNPFFHMKYRWEWNHRPIEQRAGDNPLAVDVEFANGCNFRCVMCQQSTNWLPKENERFMSWETLKTIIWECKSMGVASMKVNWRGESTLDPECGKKLTYMKDMGIHELQMNTNASKLTEDLSKDLIVSLDRIIFSCDGMSPETYNKIRRGGDFNVFLKNVTRFRRLRDEKDSKLPWWSMRKGLPAIRINMAVMEQNHHEVEDVKVLFRGIADEVFFNSVYQPQGGPGLNKGQKRQEKRKGCAQIWQRLIIDTEGNVMPCCVDYQEKLKLSNVSQTSLRNTWIKKSEGLRKAHLNHKARSLEGCKNCDNFDLSALDKDGNVVWTGAGEESKSPGC